MTNVACINMIKQQLRTNNVLDDRVLALYATGSRERFVPPNMKDFAFSDMQIPFEHEQRMMTPTEEALILQSLQLKGHERILEIGTGTGYFTSLLSQLGKEVISIEYYQDLAYNAQKKLNAEGCHNVTVLQGDGCAGWMNKAPYDMIILTGGIEAITKSHQLQLLPGGKLCAIVGKKPVMECQLLTLDHQDNWTYDVLFDTCLPSLINNMCSSEPFVF